MFALVAIRGRSPAHADAVVGAKGGGVAVREREGEREREREWEREREVYRRERV